MNAHALASVLLAPLCYVFAWLAFCLVTPFWLRHVSSGFAKRAIYAVTMPFFFLCFLLWGCFTALVFNGLSGLAELIGRLPGYYAEEYIIALHDLNPKTIERERVAKAKLAEQIAELKRAP